MDGILSQDEINALLSGMSSGNDTPETQSQNAVSQESDAFTLTEVEKDAIGEVANISMGTSATTLYSLVNKKVNITTPVVSLATWEDLQKQKEKPCVFIQIKYTSGLDGTNILILKENDVKIITDLMMGGDGTNIEGELGELHLSAISEAMNQMMGSSATSLSQMLGNTIDISPPSASLVDLEKVEADDNIADFLSGTFVKISFRMQIDELVDSTILQLYPIDFAKDVVRTFLGGTLTDDEITKEKASKIESYVPPKVDTQSASPITQNMGMPQMTSQQTMPNMGMPQMSSPQMALNMGMPQMASQNMGMPQMTMGMPQMNPGIGGNVNYQPAQFENFTGNIGTITSNENISLIMDVPLEVTVELGRTRKSIAEILDFAPGTIIELDKIAGEPIDVLVNGKFVAKGEVVVIEESFGIRVTEIIK